MIASAGEWGLPPDSALETPVEGGKDMETREISLVALYAALYAAMVVVFAPLSFYALQFRVAGVLRPGITRMRLLALGYGLGVVVGNLFSPFAGAYELLFMPFMSVVAGIVGYEAAKRLGGGYFTCGVVIAVIIPLSVSWMLEQLFGLPMLVTLPALLVSEQIINALGAMLFKLVEGKLRWWE
jgi:uncharacterized membrane protein